MNDDWPEDIPRDEQAEAEAMSEVIAWTPDRQPRQCLPRHLPRPTTVVVTDQALYIDGWVFLLRSEARWLHWLGTSVSEWSQEPCDPMTRRQLLGIIDAVERSLRRSLNPRRANIRPPDEN